MRNAQALVLVALCIALGLGLMFAKVTRLGLPLVPDQVEQVASIEATVEFKAGNGAVVVSLDIPETSENYLRLDEYFVARDYGLNIETKKGDRRAEWSMRRARGMQRLYYRAELVKRTEAAETADALAAAPKWPTKPDYGEPLASAIEDLLSTVRAESANVFTFTSQVVVAINDPGSDANIKLVRGNIKPGSEEWVQRLVYVLAGARIPARMVRGLILTDVGASGLQLVPWLEVHNGDRWEGFDPVTGDKGFPEDFVRWSSSNAPLLTVENGRSAHVSFAVTHYSRAVANIARSRADANESWLTALMLHDLPVSTQNVYQVLLMIPIGALIVALMRTVVGIPTLGTFMPILIAIAFRETQLIWGIALFTAISAFGLMMRVYLERLRLLLVPRLCAVLVIVVILMLLISLLSEKFGLVRGFSIALFPVVILTMVIEHMSVVWEESGPMATLKEGLGSLFVAIIGYLVMTNQYLSYIMFEFPELLLVLLAMFILLGCYTGYRLTELVRFRDLAVKTDAVERT